MKNNKGFSMIELIVSFSITTIIIIMLFQIIIVLKDVHTKSAIKTSLLNKQNILVDMIYKDILDNGLKNVATCGDYCITFNFKNNDTKNFSYADSTITYDDYVTSIISGSTVNKIVITTSQKIISVHMPISHKLFPEEDFGIKIIDYLS